jgi:SAM-dependent methyltransferase
MHPQIAEAIHQIVRDSGMTPARVLEVGGVVGPKSLLAAPELQQAERYCLNLVPMRSSDGIRTVTGSGNDMHMFPNESFDMVLSNATLEHDKHFWLTVAEMRRVLRPDGLMVIGVPGFLPNQPEDTSKSTSTFRVHYKFDYYRFSTQAVEEVFFDGMYDVTLFPILEPPRIIGYGRKSALPNRAAVAERARFVQRTTSRRLRHLLRTRT